jgi:DNA invertase Pin-like site-specific DNA recombinase
MNDPKIIEDVALYGRISRANGRDAEQLERHSKSEQREHATSILPRDTEHKTYRLVERDEWWDVNVSGKNFDRPGLNAVFEAVERGEVTSIAVGYLSRFGRNARELLDNLHRLHALGGTLYIGKQRLTAGPADRDPMGRLIITILAAFDELELARLTEQLDRSNRTARANGVAIQVPYGYKRENGPGSRLVFDEDGEHLPSDWTPACVVRHIFAMRADGTDDTSIAAGLNEAGIPTPTMLRHLRGLRAKPGARRWQHNTVGNLVATHTYRGVIPVGTQFVGEGKRQRAVAWEYLPGLHDPLVDADLFERAQRAPERVVRTGAVGGSLLVGLVRCAHCSQPMRPTTGGGGYGAKVLIYKCRGRRAGCETPASVVRGSLDSLVVGRIFGGWTEVEAEAQDDPREIDAARETLGEVKAELDAFDRYAKASEYGDDFQPQRNRRVGDVREAERRLARLLAARRARGGDLTREEWADLDLDERREALGDLLDAVVVQRGHRDDLDARVHLIGSGRAPFELSGTGRVVAPRAWPL